MIWLLIVLSNIVLFGIFVKYALEFLCFQLIQNSVGMNLLWQCSVVFYVGCRFFTFHATRVMKYEHTKKIRFTQICIFFVDMKKNSYLRLFKQTVSACFISRQFIQGWLVTVRNACIWIKLYRIFWKYKVESFLNFLTYHSYWNTNICRYFAIIREQFFLLKALQTYIKILNKW